MQIDGDEGNPSRRRRPTFSFGPRPLVLGLCAAGIAVTGMLVASVVAADEPPDPDAVNLAIFDEPQHASDAAIVAEAEEVISEWPIDKGSLRTVYESSSGNERYSVARDESGEGVCIVAEVGPADNLLRGVTCGSPAAFPAQGLSFVLESRAGIEPTDPLNTYAAVLVPDGYRVESVGEESPIVPGFFVIDTTAGLPTEVEAHSTFTQLDSRSDETILVPIPQPDHSEPVE